MNFDTYLSKKSCETVLFIRQVQVQQFSLQQQNQCGHNDTVPLVEMSATTTPMCRAGTQPQTLRKPYQVLDRHEAKTRLLRLCGV